jgi:hypothetical protein
MLTETFWKDSPRSFVSTTHEALLMSDMARETAHRFTFFFFKQPRSLVTQAHETAADVASDLALRNISAG